MPRLTVSQLLTLLFEFHLQGKASFRPLNSNRVALCKSSGDIYYDGLTEPDILHHIMLRRAGSLTGTRVGPQTIKHDLKLLTLLYNVVKGWKRRRYVIGGVDFSTLEMPLENPVAEIKRPRTKPRKRPVSANDFSLWVEHAPERLKQRAYFAIDTGLNPIELKRLKPSDYNSYTDCLDLQRGKSGEVGSIPVTERCRLIIFDAIKNQKKKILDFTNEQKDIEATRRRSGVYFWFGRDLRCTYYNQILQATGRDYRAAQRAMLHSDPRTGPAHYEIDEGKDLRVPINRIEKVFA